jgi:hypothetical protein
VSLERIGDARLRLGDTVGALAAIEEGLATRRFAAQQPGNTRAQRDVVMSLNRIGDVRLREGDAAGALAVYEEGLAIARRLAALEPGNVQAQTDLVVSLYRLSTVTRGGARRAALDEATRIADDLAARGLLSADQTGWPKALRDLRNSPDP